MLFKKQLFAMAAIERKFDCDMFTFVHFDDLNEVYNELNEISDPFIVAPIPARLIYLAAEEFCES